MNEKNSSRLQAGEIKFSRTIKCKTRRDRARNTEIRENLNVGYIKERTEKMRIRWFGHVKRMGGRNVT